MEHLKLKALPAITMTMLKRLASNASTVVEQSTTDPEINGSNPLTTWHQEKLTGKSQAEKAS